MRFGISLFPTDTSARPDVVAAEAETRGYASFWVSEHSHMPTSTQFPLSDEVPREYCSMWDPFVALSAAAMVTEKITLGTAIIILPQRDPINCAKSVSTLDLLSNGRTMLGIGAGWNEPELRNHCTDPTTRFKLMRERVEVMRSLWTQERAEYHGDLVQLEPSWQWPKPIQRPHPPVLVAGAGPTVINRVARYGDGWLPVVVPEATDISPGRMTPLADFAELVPRMNALAEQAGRGRPRIVVSGYLDARSYDVYQSCGVESLSHRVPSEDFDSIRRSMDEFEQTVVAAGGSLQL